MLNHLILKSSLSFRCYNIPLLDQYEREIPNRGPFCDIEGDRKKRLPTKGGPNYTKIGRIIIFEK